MKRVFLFLTLLTFTLVGYSAESVKMCTGSKSGVYYLAGQTLSNATDKNFLKIDVVSTRGSWQNLKFLAKGDCQIAVVQADAYALFSKRHASDAVNFDRVGTLHDEYTHLVCNKDSGVKDAGDLESGKYTLAVGKPGSGSWVTLNYWIVEDDDYKKVPTVSLGGIIAASKVADGSDVQCLLYNSGLGNGYMNKIDARFGDRVRLVDATDSDFNDAKDPKGNDLYKFTEIPSRTYPQNLQNGVFTSIDTIKQSAILIVDMAYFSENEEEYEALLEAYSISDFRNKK